MSSAALQQAESVEGMEPRSIEQADDASDREMTESGAVAANAEANAPHGRELAAVLEAMLFVSGEPVPLAKLAAVVGTVSKAEVEQALKTLQAQLEQEGRGIQLVKVAGGYRLVTKSDYAPWLKRLDKAKTVQKLSRSALESLAIIAYKQPLVRADIEEIRGVETSGVIRTLLERKLVRIVGRKEVPGRPIMYGTTKFFLEHFGLEDLGQLPPLREFKELGEAEQALLPIEETTGIGEASEEEAALMGEPERTDFAGPQEGETVLVEGEHNVEMQHEEPCLGEPVEQT